ncbi:hypothetical protein [Curtobacterium flaccumfaciens]|uniref:hypothetical protein n=1 Tax=Curtobacterium flaccumfaciens TaxID=2035 RepID=UPI003994A339
MGWLTTSRSLAALTEEVRALNRRFDGIETRICPSNRAAQVIVLWVITAILIGSTLILLHQALPPSPSVTAPGRIGVALAEDPSDLTVLIDTQFDASEDSATLFRVSVTVIPKGDRSLAAQPAKVAFLFCGPIREALRLDEINHRPLSRLQPVRESLIEDDSFIGPRSECSVMTAKTNGLPIYIVGNSAHVSNDISGRRALYAFAGTQTLISSRQLGVPDRINGQALWSVPDGTALTTTVSALPHDALIDAASPQLPQTGQPSWSTLLKSGNSTLPLEYRLAATLSDADNASQAELFFAGVLAGLGGGTFTAALPPTITSILRRKKR